MTTAATVDASQTRPGKGWNIALWVAQLLLALAFGMAGFMKLTTPLDVLAHKMAWVASAGGLVRFIGASEVTGALGMLLPALTGIQPKLTAWAGVGLATIMVLATAFHISRGEANVIGVNFVLGGLAAFVAWGRFRKAPIQPRA